MDDDDEKTYKTPMFLYFNLKVHLYLCFLVNETTNPQLLDCCRSIPATHVDTTIPDSAKPRLESFIPHSSQVSIYHIKVYRILIIPV